jgi:hypothetical protein
MGKQSLKRTSLARRHRTFLIRLYKAYKRKQKNAKNIIRQATPSEILSLSEICQNLLLGNLQIPKRNLNNAKKHKHLIRDLGSTHIKPEIKRHKLLNQRGGVLISGILVPIIGALLSGAVSSLIKKNV